MTKLNLTCDSPEDKCLKESSKRKPRHFVLTGSGFFFFNIKANSKETAVVWKTKYNHCMIQFERPRRRKEDNIKVDIKGLGCKDVN